MEKLNLKDMVKSLKERTGKMVEGEYEARPKKKVEEVVEETPVVEKAPEPEVEEVVDKTSKVTEVEDTTPDVSAKEDNIPADDIDAKIAEYYRKKKAKIAELEKLEEEETNKIISKTSAYDEKKREYAEIFSGIKISRDDLDKENIGKAVLDEFTLREEDFSDDESTTEEKIEAGIIEDTTMGMPADNDEEETVKVEMAAEPTDDIDNYIVETSVSGEETYTPAKELGKIEPEVEKSIDTVITAAKKKPTTKKETLKSLTDKLTSKKESVAEEKEKTAKKKTTAKKSTAKKSTTKTTKSTTKKATTKKATTKKADEEKEAKSTTKKTTTKTAAKTTKTTTKTTAKKTTKKSAETEETFKLTTAELNELVDEVIEADNGLVLDNEDLDIIAEAVIASGDKKELTDGWTVDDYNKLVGIKEEPVTLEERAAVSKDGALDSAVALSEADIEHLEKGEEDKTSYFYGSAEHKENEEELNKPSETTVLGKEVELGDRNFNKDIANATPSSEVVPMGEDKELTEEERFAKEMEFIYTIFGVEEKPKTENSEQKQKKVLYVATECQPFVATGGLADVAGSLPNAIADLGVDIRVIMPLYGTIKNIYRQDFEFLGNFTVHLSWRQEYCGLFRYYSDGVTYYFVDNERYFKRPNLYGYFDDGERFAYFCRAVVECLPHIDFFPDIIHCNDWQSSLVPTYMKTDVWTDPRYYQIKHIYTIHNVEYQGVYGMENLKDLFGIEERFTHDMEYDGVINLTKAAIQLSDRVTTVSHSYCDNLKQPYCSRGLHHIIYRNEHKLSGIINGINNDFYNPATDDVIAYNYDIDNLEGKRKCKKAWQEELGLPVDPDTPLISMVTRLVSHKGLDLVTKIMEELLQDDIQFVIVGTGDQRFIEYFRYLEDKYPTKVRALVDKFSLEYGKKNYAASDIFVMPSKIEPCGISQMVSSRYGSVPIVRECGGLKDTITDFGCEGGGNGYTFTHYNSEDLKYQIKRAISDYHDKEGWAEKMRIVMSQDYSWSKSAKEYVELYESVLK